MSNSENKQIKSIIDINKDAAEFYFESAEKLAENKQLEATFKDLGTLHADITKNLESFLIKNGDTDVKADETMVGEMSKFWGLLKARISNDTDETLVVQLEEAEDRCLHSIQDAIKSDDITSDAKAILEREHTALRKSHDYMKGLKDYMQAA